MKAQTKPRVAGLVYLPLLMHLVPTLAIGFGFVIPQSGMAGMNELTIGFGAANLGFVLSYVAGVRLAQRRSVLNA